LNINKYNNFIKKDTTLYEFLDFILSKIEIEFNKYNIKGGFIASLDESKVSSRFKIISSVGKFLNSHNMKVISAKEIDKLSTVFISKKSLVRGNLYIDIINQDSKDIFIYLEFESNLNDNEQIQLTNYFDIINLIIKNTQWGEHMNTMIEQINELPALEKTIVDTLNFSTKLQKKTDELIEILSTDPLITATLLKTVNSAIFGFKNEVDSLENLIYLMGMDFTISIVLANNIQDNVKIDISAYNLSQDEFKKYLALKIRFMTSYLRKVNPEIQKNLYLPLILQDLGKFILSIELANSNKTPEFLNELKLNPQSIDKIEIKYCGHTSSEITIMILEHWNLNQNIIDCLNGENKESASYLKLINTIFNISKPFEEQFIQNAIAQAQKLNLDIDFLKNQIDIIKEDI